jgi:tetratricopeptide (TPR) repeat protein
MRSQPRHSRSLIAGLVLFLGLALVSGCASPGPQKSERAKGPLHHYQMARMFYEQGQVQRAFEEIHASKKLDDTLPQVHFYEGYMYWNMAKWEEAEQHFRKALSLNAIYLDARMYLAGTLEQQGRVEEALAELDAALRMQNVPNIEQARVNKAMILKRLGRLDEALTELRQAVATRPRYYRAHFEMAGILEESGEAEEALDALEAARAGYEKSAEFHYRHGAALFRLGRAREAVVSLEKAMELAPGTETASRARELLKVIG